jgi:hypothetical protein
MEGKNLKSGNLGIIAQTGFRDVDVKLKKYTYPPFDAGTFQKDGAEIRSITVYGEKD